MRRAGAFTKRVPDAGWYPDPRDPECLRWWDGSQWSEQTRPTAASVGDKFTAAMLKLVQATPYIEGQGQEYPLEACGAQLVGPSYSGDRLRDFRRNAAQTKHTTALIFGAAVLMTLVMVIIGIVQGEGGMVVFSLLFLAAFGAFGAVFARSFASWRKPFLATPSEAYGLPEGTLVTITGVVEAGEPGGLWGDPNCVWTYFWPTNVDRRDAVPYHTTSGKLWLSDGRGGPRVAVDLGQLVSVEGLGEPAEVHAGAVAWAICLQDEISISGKLHYDSPEQLTIVTVPTTVRKNGSTIVGTEAIKLGHPLAAYTPGEVRIDEISDSDAARPAFGGRIGPSVVVLPAGFEPKVRGLAALFSSKKSAL